MGAMQKEFERSKSSIMDHKQCDQKKIAKYL